MNYWNLFNISILWLLILFQKLKIKKWCLDKSDRVRFSGSISQFLLFNAIRFSIFTSELDSIQNSSRVVKNSIRFESITRFELDNPTRRDQSRWNACRKRSNGSLSGSVRRKWARLGLACPVEPRIDSGLIRRNLGQVH